MSDSLQPHRLKSTNLLCPWDFSGNNTGVGCHFSSSRGSSQPRDPDHVSCVSCIAGRFFTYWATGEALVFLTSCFFYPWNMPSFFPPQGFYTWHFFSSTSVTVIGLSIICNGCISNIWNSTVDLITRTILSYVFITILFNNLSWFINPPATSLSNYKSFFLSRRKPKVRSSRGFWFTREPILDLRENKF